MAPAPNTDFDPERFAALVARFDIGNPSDAEAMTAARIMRRGLIEKNLRFVDVMARADVGQALDALLKPVREESPELKAAFLEIAKYAEIARQQAEAAAQLQRKLAVYRNSNAGPRGLVNGRLVLLVVILMLGLMIAAHWQ